MSTKLNNAVIRESTETVDNRQIIISLNEDQTISLKRKGMKSGTVTMGIKELWFTLNDGEHESEKEDQSSLKMDDYWEGEDDEAEVVKVKPVTKHPGGPMVSLQRLRTLNATTPGKIEVIARIDELIVDLMEENKKS